MSNQPVEVRLIILTGAKVGEEILVEEEACLGRLPECDLVLDDKLASRKHAKVKVGPEGVYLEDLGSSNGTLLHDERIHEARLEDGDQFEIGHIRIRVRIQPQLKVGEEAPEGFDEIQLEGIDEPPAAAPAVPMPPPEVPVPPPEVQVRSAPGREPSGPAHAASSGAPGKQRASKGHRGRGGGLQYSRIESRGGLLGDDLWQRTGLAKILILAVVLAAGAGLFLLAYHAVS